MHCFHTHLLVIVIRYCVTVVLVVVVLVVLAVSGIGVSNVMDCACRFPSLTHHEFDIHYVSGV